MARHREMGAEAAESLDTELNYCAFGVLASVTDTAANTDLNIWSHNLGWVQIYFTVAGDPSASTNGIQAELVLATFFILPSNHSLWN